MTGQKLKYSEINLFSCHYVPHKSLLSNPGYHRDRLPTNQMSLSMSWIKCWFR